MSLKKLKPISLHKTLSRRAKFRQELYAATPKAYHVMRWWVKAKHYITAIGPVVIIVGTMLVAAIIYMLTNDGVYTQNQIIARQSQLLNMLTLMVAAWLWGFLVKFRKTPIPRGPVVFTQHHYSRH